MTRFFLLFTALWLVCLPVAAHEVRPALLDLSEKNPGNFTMVWKQPLKDGKRLAITPLFEPLCKVSETAKYEFYGTSVAEIRTLACPLTSGKIHFKGLESTLTDSYVRIEYLNGDSRNGLVGANDPFFSLTPENQGAAVPAYLSLGISHIFAGWDHLALVVGLLLLVPVRRIWLVITSFTLAHSITLGFAAMGVISLPGLPVEILIALSIAWLAYEAVQDKRPQKQDVYWLSFAFGLLHGFGFAGVLGELGLPAAAELQALLLFNIGIELGQIAFICMCLAAVWSMRKMFSTSSLSRFEQGFPYALGGLGMFWALERFSSYLI
ncbi:MAG: HupE/UreJ family protein [Parvibaculales bacterium]